MSEPVWPQADPNRIGLWRYNPVTGMWVLERSCMPDTASEWLLIFQAGSDDKDSTYNYVLSKKRPTKPPKYPKRFP